jgi:hypothetical protein
MTWQRATIIEAVSYLEALVAGGAEDERTEHLLRDLREVLEPRLRLFRLERERELDQMDAHGEGAVVRDSGHGGDEKR